MREQEQQEQGAVSDLPAQRGRRAAQGHGHAVRGAAGTRGADLRARHHRAQQGGKQGTQVPFLDDLPAVLNTLQFATALLGPARGVSASRDAQAKNIYKFSRCLLIGEHGCLHELRDARVHGILHHHLYFMCDLIGCVILLFSKPYHFF